MCESFDQFLSLRRKLYFRAFKLPNKIIRCFNGTLNLAGYPVQIYQMLYEFQERVLLCISTGL